MKSIKSAKIVPLTPSPAVSLKKVLVPVDFSPASEQAFTYARTLCHEFGANLILLHVLEPPALPGFAGMEQAPGFLKKASLDAEKNLRQLMAPVEEGEKKAMQWKIRSGLAAHEINAAAKEADVDLVIIGSHGLTSGKHFCIGTTSERVARAAPCSVLIIREKEYEL